MHEPLKLSETTADGHCVLVLDGELDIETAMQFRTAVSTLLGTGCRDLELDLAAMTFLDSSGLGAMVWAAHRVRGAGGDFSVTHPRPNIARTLEITGVKGVLAVH